jgi:hypothetical protein
VQVVQPQPDPAAALDLTRAVHQMDARVQDGVYTLTDTAIMTLNGSAARQTQLPARNGPLLVLIHDLCADTVTSFGGLWTHGVGLVQRLFEDYDGEVHALEHATLGRGVLANAITLAQVLPPGARLHLLGHGRGGLVAEALACVAAGMLPPDPDPSTFAGAGSMGQYDHLRALVRDRGIRVERVVQVGSPLLGMGAGWQLDLHLSLLRWCLERERLPVPTALTPLILEVARRRAGPSALPGTADMLSNSALVGWLNRQDVAMPGDQRIILGACVADETSHWLSGVMQRQLGDSSSESDLQATTASMCGGAVRHGTVLYRQLPDDCPHFHYMNHRTGAEAVVAALVDGEPDGFGRSPP